MTSETLEKEIKEAVPKLLDAARELTWNNIADNCKFILTEIKNSTEDFYIQRPTRIKENDKKMPVAFSGIMPALQVLYDNLYDINLHVYKANKHFTIVEIRYYPKSSLDQEYRQKVLHDPPMLHCKVAHPPWLTEKKEKFDINWEHKKWLITWKMFWTRRKFKHNRTRLRTEQ